MSNGVSSEAVLEQPPFDVASRKIDGLDVRYARGGNGSEKIVLLSPWPESIFAFAPVWNGLTKQFEVLAIDLPGFGQSEARDNLFAPQAMGEFIAKAVDAFGLTKEVIGGFVASYSRVCCAALRARRLSRVL